MATFSIRARSRFGASSDLAGTPAETGRRAYKWLYERILNRTYDVAIRWWALPFGGENRFRRALLEPVKFGPRERILDLCCGTGGASAAIRERVGARARVVGLEQSSGRLRSARRRSRPGLRFVAADAGRCAFADGGFDRVFVSHALHEMTRAERNAVLREAWRLLRSGGSVVALELDRPPSRLLAVLVGFWFLYWAPFNFETPTRRDLFRSGLDHEVASAGFRSVTKASRYRGIFQVVQGVKP